MGINFPNAPAVGELHPTPPQAGVPQYRWDGTAWVAQSQDQLAFVKRTGDTMSGALTLPADPAAALQAATKQYVDAKSSLYISDNPPTLPPDGSMWWDSDNGLLYIRYNDGAGPSQWVQAVATPAIDSSVFVNKAGDTMGGALTLPGDPAAALQAAPKQYVDAVRAYAAPYDAIAYSGMQINGSMEVSQAIGFNAYVAGGKTLDGWTLTGAGTSAMLEAQIDATAYFNGRFDRCLGMSVATGQPSLGAADYISNMHQIEYIRMARLRFGTSNASPITIAFWTHHARGGLYSVGVRNYTGTRSYVATYTQAANTSQYNVITIPGDTAGTWLPAADNLTGMSLSFVAGAGAGSGITAPSANTWLAGNYIAAPGQVNGIAATSDIFRITGLVVLPGTQAPTAAQSPMIMRPYDQELMLCMRYFEKTTYPIIGTTVPTSGYSYVTWFYKAVKRATPTTVGGAGTIFTMQYNAVEHLTGYTTNVAANATLGTGTTSDARL